jgi:WD40 repeat protein
VGDDATLNLWNASDGRLLKSIATQVNNWLANCIMYSPDGQKVLLAYGCPYSDCAINREGDLRQVDLSTEQVQTLIPYGVYALTFSTDQANFAIDGEQQRQSGQRNGEQYVVQRSYRSPLGNGFTRGAAISPDGQLFFSGNFGGIHVWNATSGEMIALCKGAQLPYGIMRLSPDQKILFVASPDGVMSLWGVLSTQ